MNLFSDESPFHDLPEDIRAEQVAAELCTIIQLPGDPYCLVHGPDTRVRGVKSGANHPVYCIAGHRQATGSLRALATAAEKYTPRHERALEKRAAWDIERAVQYQVAVRASGNSVLVGLPGLTQELQESTSLREEDVATAAAKLIRDQLGKFAARDQMTIAYGTGGEPTS